MKIKSLTLLSLLAALPAAAQVVQIGDLAGFKEALKGIESPAVATTRPLTHVVAARPASCPVLDLAGATVGRGLFESEYTVKIGDQEVGKVSSSGGGLSYTAGGASQAKITLSSSGDTKTATVVGCDGAVIGKIVELQGSDSSSFSVLDAAGSVLAQSGNVDSTTWSLSGAGGSASIANAHWLVDRYALSMSGIDGRLVLTAAILNNQALYRRSAQRRRDHIGDRPGRIGGGDR